MVLTEVQGGEAQGGGWEAWEREGSTSDKGCR